jgi:hypothetical protein
MAGKKRETIRQELRELLKDKLSKDSNAKRGNREKTILILMKIWADTAPALEGPRGAGLELLKAHPREMELPVHWGMSMAVYPFFGIVAGAVGRLLRLQGSFSISQAQRRLREQYGERETISRAAQRVIRTFYDWGVITQSGGKGIYLPGGIRNITDITMISWLIEAVLYITGEKRGNFKEIAGSPSLFPFKLGPISSGQLITGGRVEVIRHNLDEDLILIKNVPRLTNTK